MASNRSTRQRRGSREELLPMAMPSVATLNMTELLGREGVELRDVIGRGTYSNVKRAWSQHLRASVAVKIIDRRTGTDFVRRFLPRELLIVQQLQHPNIIRVHQVVDTGNIVCLVEEYAEHGDLLQRIKLLKRIPEIDARPIFRQLIEALEYLRTHEIVHRDVKCENVFLDKHDNVKLGDFGFARRMRATDVSQTFCGSRAYVAPEILGANPYRGVSCDIWSAGIVLYIMVTGLMPYDDRNTRHMMEKQLQHRVTFPRSIDRLISHDVKLLVYIILHPDPVRRAKFVDIVSSAWLANTPYEMRVAAQLVDGSASTAPRRAVHMAVSTDEK